MRVSSLQGLVLVLPADAQEFFRFTAESIPAWPGSRLRKTLPLPERERVRRIKSDSPSEASRGECFSCTFSIARLLPESSNKASTLASSSELRINSSVALSPRRRWTRIQDDRLPCTGLPGQNIEPLREAQIHLIDDRKMFDAKVLQHNKSLYEKSLRS